jgi:multiple sugar transport system substrate-binding protein
VATGALVPVDTLFAPEELREWQETSVGPTWASYHLDGHQWALPIDAAAQVSVARPDLVRSPLPTTWFGVTDLAARVPTALCLGGPHALLMLLAMCAWSHPAPAADQLVDPRTGTIALRTLQDLWPRVDPEVSLLDPIGVHEALAGASGVAYCPLVYGYASYARSAHPLAWSDAPTARTARPGSVLGGAGLAVSSRDATDLGAVRDFVRGFLAAAVQTGLVPDHGGQPARRDVWRPGPVDQAWGGFYSGTSATVEQAWVRPRHPGWIRFQDEVSELVRDAVMHRADPGRVVDQLNALYVHSLNSV